MEVKRDSFLRAHLRHLNQLMRGPYTIQLSEKFNRKTEPQNFLARSLRTHSRRSCENEVVFPRLHEPSANSKLHLLVRAGPWQVCLLQNPARLVPQFANIAVERFCRRKVKLKPKTLVRMNADLHFFPAARVCHLQGKCRRQHLSCTLNRLVFGPWNRNYVLVRDNQQQRRERRRGNSRP